MTKKFQTGGVYQVGVDATGILREPRPNAPLETEALFGEGILVLGSVKDYVHAKALLDSYEGYVHASALQKPLLEPTHRITVSEAVTYEAPSFKCMTKGSLYMNSPVCPIGTEKTAEGDMVEIEGKGWVFADRLVPIGHRASSIADEAAKFVGTPYLWGGRSSLIDCSALVQAGCIAAGIPCPRDAFPQSEELGEVVELEEGGLPELDKDYLVFWTEGKGRHVVIMIDGINCVHATIAPPYRRTLIQPLTEVIEDQARDGNGGVTGVRRLPTALLL